MSALARLLALLALAFQAAGAPTSARAQAAAPAPAPVESSGGVLSGDELPAAPDLALPADYPPAAARSIGALNNRFLILNMHGALFHDRLADLEENVRYAAWMQAGAIRVFATDAGELVEWSGERIGDRIADLAPTLRANGVKLIVALVNNHRAVPGERVDAFGWMDDYYQLLLPFYTESWRGAYLNYARGIIGTVARRGAQDVIWAWELGNELHTPREPRTVLSFINAAAAEVRRLDPNARILPGTMGVNHLDPHQETSPVARALYCHAAISAYTLHTYDWQTPDYWGDMPIHWDFEHVLNEPCPNGRKLPIIVEELGTSRVIPGVYGFDEEEKRFEEELNQIRMVLKYDGVIGIGAWSAVSPAVQDISRHDKRRGLTSYGPDNLGSGSCYGAALDSPPPGVRCKLERVLRALPALP